MTVIIKYVNKYDNESENKQKKVKDVGLSLNLEEFELMSWWLCY